jgi:heme exporter protein A
MKPLLRFDDVALSRGGRLLFEGLNLTLESGEALQVAGPNGSGKSSLLRLAAGLLRPLSGQVERSSLALADDSLALDREMPLRRALGFWSCGRDNRLDDAMAALGLAHLGGTPVRLLSSGQAKRASLARVAASGAPLWLLDEPLNALDGEGAERLGEMLHRHRQNGGAILAASHQALAGEWSRLELGA